MPLSAGRLGALRSVLCVWRRVGGWEVVCGAGGGKAAGAGAGGCHGVRYMYFGLKFGDMDRRLRSIQVSDLCATIHSTTLVRLHRVEGYRPTLAIVVCIECYA
eukprot:COSAG02_NODE_62_length_43372_cov_14.404710_18_plen_103_part_00